MATIVGVPQPTAPACAGNDPLTPRPPPVTAILTPLLLLPRSLPGCPAAWRPQPPVKTRESMIPLLCNCIPVGHAWGGGGAGAGAVAARARWQTRRKPAATTRANRRRRCAGLAAPLVPLPPLSAQSYCKVHLAVLHPPNGGPHRSQIGSKCRQLALRPFRRPGLLIVTVLFLIAAPPVAWCSHQARSWR